MIWEVKEEVIYPTLLFVSILGLCINVISVVYFIRRERTGIASSFLILLNALDITWFIHNICTTSFYIIQMDTMTSSITSTRFIADVHFFLVLIAGPLSGWITFILSVARYLAIAVPLYRIRKRLLWVVVLTFISMIFVSVLGKFVEYIPINKGVQRKQYTVSMIWVMLFSVLIIAVCISTIYKLRRKVNNRYGGQDMCQRNRYAAVTVAIMGCIYVSTFVPVIIYLFVSRADSDDLRFMGANAGGVIASSILNPCVYMIRKREMRRFVKEILCCKVFASQINT